MSCSQNPCGSTVAELLHLPRPPYSPLAMSENYKETIIGDHRIVTTLCPGGKERMRRLMEVIRQKRVDLTPLITHRFSLDEIGEGYRVFGERLEGVMKVAIKPAGI